jgi:hypothetical protein
MVLSQEKIRREIQSPSKKKEIRAAIAQQDRIKFHADTNLEAISGEALTKFKTFVKSLLPDDKFALTMNLLKFPVQTNEVCESIWVRLSKIFDGRNPAFDYEFKTTQERDDWEWYRQVILHEPSVWSDKAWEYFKTEINCVIVVDMPSEVDPSDRYPQPYFYFVPIDSVISYSVNRRTNLMDWIIYRVGDDRVIAIDSENYWVFKWDNAAAPNIGPKSVPRGGKLGDLLAQNPHGLGFCPSRFFWDEPLSLSNPDIKKSPLSKELADLDWYLFYSLGKKHLDTYAGYPIYSAYEEECDYSDKAGNTCHHGFLAGPDGNILTDALNNPVKCPICSQKKQIAGAGTFVSVPIPEPGEVDLRRPIDITTIDVKSLQYNVDEKERLRKHIISSCVGVDNTILNEVSLADKQVDASFESQDVVLNRVKKGFESAQMFVDTTCCILRYRDAFISASVNYGTEFYTLTAEVLQSRYNKAREGGASDYELDALKRQLIETTYRHNPTQLQRMIILGDLEPFPHLSKEEVFTRYKEGIIPKELLTLKDNFSGFIRRFERTHGNILEFGALMPYDKKIDTIYKTLLSYAEAESAPALDFTGELPSS